MRHSIGAVLVVAAVPLASALQPTASLLHAQHAPLLPTAAAASSRRAVAPLLQLPDFLGSSQPPAAAGGKLVDVPSVDWSKLLDAAYLITCPQPDGTNPRLDTAWKQVEAVGLAGITEVCEFGTDDDDRIRGCYTSHISVLEAAEKRFADRPADEQLNVLVLEDNLSISPRIEQQTLDAMETFLSKESAAAFRPDMVHLAYIMYVPGLSVETLPAQDHVVRLQCNADSVLGTTAYVISRQGLETLLAEHRRTGYVDAIPNMMARLFPNTRYAAYPMPLHRAAKVKSLVNGQLDALRSLIFQPQVYTQWEKLLVATGLSTNVLFPALLLGVLLGAIAGFSETVSAILAAFRGEDVNLVLPVLSALISGACLVVLGYGLALAPQPETAKEKA